MFSCVRPKTFLRICADPQVSWNRKRGEGLNQLDHPAEFSMVMISYGDVKISCFEKVTLLGDQSYWNPQEAPHISDTFSFYRSLICRNPLRSKYLVLIVSNGFRLPVDGAKMTFLRYINLSCWYMTSRVASMSVFLLCWNKSEDLVSISAVRWLFLRPELK